jgi:hypothetical protein
MCWQQAVHGIHWRNVHRQFKMITHSKTAAWETLTCHSPYSSFLQSNSPLLGLHLLPTLPPLLPNPRHETGMRLTEQLPASYCAMPRRIPLSQLWMRCQVRHMLQLPGAQVQALPQARRGSRVQACQPGGECRHGGAEP